MGQLLDARDYCKLHIVEHYVAILMGAKRARSMFRVLAVGNVGSDLAGEALMLEIAEAGIDTYVLMDPKRNTLFSVTLLYPDQSGGNITTSNSAAGLLSDSQLSECRKDLAAAAEQGIALCLPEVHRKEFLRTATECRSYRVASFASGEIERVRKLNLLSQVGLLALNDEEAAVLADILLTGTSREQMLKACSSIAAKANPNVKVLVSVGADGAYIMENGAWSHTTPLRSMQFRPREPVTHCSLASLQDWLRGSS